MSTFESKVKYQEVAYPYMENCLGNLKTEKEKVSNLFPKIPPFFTLLLVTNIGNLLGFCKIPCFLAFKSEHINNLLNDNCVIVM